MMTARQYEESLRKLKLEVYMFGKRIESVVDDPIIRPSMNAVAVTYELAQRPEYAELMTAVSHLTSKRINRFCHIHRWKRIRGSINNMLMMSLLNKGSDEPVTKYLLKRANQSLQPGIY
jgi:aromatic ring hydroxylase